MSPIGLSIVVAAPAGVDPTACLHALAPQVSSGIELIIVADETTALPEQMPATVVRRSALAPEQWAEGIGHATGELIALTASSVMPTPTWVEDCARIQRCRGGIAGGVVLPGEGLSPADWALYFCRYARYLNVQSAVALDAPADNVCYRRAELTRFSGSFADAFLEPFVHAQMVNAGIAERVFPELVVRTVPGYPAHRFARQRFAHGRAHGFRWARAEKRRRVLVGIASTPLVPLVLCARRAIDARGLPQRTARLVTAAPWMLWFTAAWACGELIGRLNALVSERAA